MSFQQLQIYKISAIQRNKTNTILLFIATEHLDPVAREPAAAYKTAKFPILPLENSE